MVRFAINDPKGPVYLFHKYEPHQLVGKGEPGKGQEQISLLYDRLIQAQGASYDEVQLASA